MVQRWNMAGLPLSTVPIALTGADAVDGNPFRAFQTARSKHQGGVNASHATARSAFTLTASVQPFGRHFRPLVEDRASTNLVGSQGNPKATGTAVCSQGTSNNAVTSGKIPALDNSPQKWLSAIFRLFTKLFFARRPSCMVRPEFESTTGRPRIPGVPNRIGGSYNGWYSC